MPLTKGQLRQMLDGELGHLPDDTLIVLSKDAGGNALSPLTAIDGGRYLAENTWSGERYPVNSEQGEAQEDAVPAIFLWPTH